VRRPAFLLVVLAAAAVLVRRRIRAGAADRDLWTEATAPLDLR